MVVCELLACPDPEKVARVIQCDGRCRKTFHIACVGVTGPHLKAHQENDGVLWLCSDCRRNRGDALLEKIDANRIGLADLAKRMETYFEVVVTKLDTHLTLIRELASTTATSNALNVELITRTSSNATFNFEDSLSAVPDKICPSASENPYDEAIQRSSETAVQVSTSQGGNENDMQRNSSPIPVELQSGNPKSSASRIQSTNAKIVGSRSCSHGSATAHQANIPTSNANSVSPFSSNPFVINAPPSAYPACYYAPWTPGASGLFCHPYPMATALPRTQQSYFGFAHPADSANKRSNVKRKKNNIRGSNVEATFEPKLTAAQNLPSGSHSDQTITYCVRNLSPDTNAAHVQRYIASKGRIPETAISCSSVAKKGKHISFQTFRVIIPQCYAGVVSSDDFWPDGVTISVFGRPKAVSLPIEI